MNLIGSTTGRLDGKGVRGHIGQGPVLPARIGHAGTSARSESGWANGKRSWSQTIGRQIDSQLPFSLGPHELTADETTPVLNCRNFGGP
jgi:hypothetical protein